MQQKIYDVEMMYIQNTSGNDYTVETMSRRSKNIKLNFSNVDGVEINTQKPLEIKNSFLSMSDSGSKVWNMRFAYPTNFNIKFLGKIIFEVI